MGESDPVRNEGENDGVRVVRKDGHLFAGALDPRHTGKALAPLAMNPSRTNRLHRLVANSGGMVHVFVALWIPPPYTIRYHGGGSTPLRGRGLLNSLAYGVQKRTAWGSSALPEGRVWM